MAFVEDPGGPKAPPAVAENEKSASGTLIKRPKRKTREEKHIQALQMVEWATDISGKHPNLIHTFLTSKDERVQFEAFKLVTAYRWGLPTGRAEVDLNAAARILAASRGISQQALLARAARIVDAVTVAPEPIQPGSEKKSDPDVVDAEPVE
jgi:hypothetical protein